MHGKRIRSRDLGVRHKINNKMTISKQLNYISIQSIKVLIVLISILLPYVALSDELDDHVQKLSNHASIDWHQVSAPIGNIILAKRATEICAIKFTKFERNRIIEPSSWSYSGGETFTAEYNWLFFDSNQETINPIKKISGRGKVVDKPVRGIPFTHITLGFSKDRVKCGSFKLFWMYPTSVSFNVGPSCGDYSIELAPTKITNFEQVSTALKKAKWYKCDEKRKRTYISLDEL